jgi:transposase
MEVIVERVAGLDVHKETVMAAVRVPGERGRSQKVKEFATFNADLLALRRWLADEGVTLVVMEATGVYWRAPWHVLEEYAGWELMLVNARHVKNLPGRKTDVSDAAWLAQLAECGLLRGSFVPPAVIGELRDLTRYRKKLVEDRAKEVQRVQKTLEDAGIKLDSVASDVLGVSGRAMLTALVAGERDPVVLAELAKGPLRRKIPALRHALQGRFNEHHALMIGMALEHSSYLEASIARLDDAVDALFAAHTSEDGVPFARARDHLDTITGVGKRAAETVIAEIGVDMTRFPTAAHLASWAGLAPGNNVTGGKRRSGTTTKGDVWLVDVLHQCAWAASHTRDTYLAAQFWRLARRIGKKKAATAVAHSILVICWHLLANDCDYDDLGGDYFTRRNTDRQRNRLISQLHNLGYRVTLEQPA